MGLKSYDFASLHQPVCERSNLLKTQFALCSYILDVNVAFFRHFHVTTRNTCSKDCGGGSVVLEAGRFYFLRDVKAA